MLPIMPLTVGFVAGFSAYRAYYNARRPPAAAPDAPLAADDAGHNDARPMQERQRRCCSLISFCFLLAIPRLAATYDAEKASRPWFCVWRPGKTMRDTETDKKIR